MQINNLRLTPNWKIEDRQGESLHVAFLPLLAALNRNNTLTRAADECGLSYRLAWNILQDAERFFGHPVVKKQRGRGASLTTLGRVLTQANQRIEGRLHTQMEALAMELNAEVHKALSDQVGVLTIYASHGYAVALLPRYLDGYQAELHYHGPEDALRALNAGDCQIAGFNLPLHQRIPDVQLRYSALLNPEKIVVLSFIRRQQGLIISDKHTHRIKSLADLAGSNLRFINRQPRSGTRELIDYLLAENGIGGEQIRGYDNHEYTHSAVAAHVATGMADVGFGVKAAAARFDLPFVSVTEDRYYWAYRVADEAAPEISALINTLAKPALQQEVNQLAGYQCEAVASRVNIESLFD